MMNEENAKTEKLEHQAEEKIEGLTEPLEGEKDIEPDPTQEEPVDGENAPKRKRRIAVGGRPWSGCNRAVRCGHHGRCNALEGSAIRKRPAGAGGGCA